MSTGGNGSKKKVWQLILALPSHETAVRLTKWIESWVLEPILITTLWLFLLIGIVLTVDPVAFYAILTTLALLSPIWLPYALGVGLWIVWIDYVRFIAWFNDEKIVLEIQVPAEIEKSPHAMEVVFASIWNATGETTFISRFWRGRSRPIWSFEIAGNEGKIGYYIHGSAAWRNIIESAIYGQFPEAQVRQVPDYTNAVDFNLDEWDNWNAEYKKSGYNKETADVQALPIKLYTQFELDKNTDVPETKIDPLTNILEMMNTCGKDEYLWVQYIVRARNKDDWYGIQARKTDDFKDPAIARIQTIMAGAAKRAQTVLKEADIIEGKMNALLTDGEKKEIEAIERNMGKPIFEAGVRIVYVGKKERFRRVMGAPLYRGFEPFHGEFNEIKGAGSRGNMVRWDYPWEDFRGIRKAMVKVNQFFFYKHRAYFWVPYDQTPVFLSTEELASLWHFPGSAVKTPGLNRVASQRSTAPPNLPTGPQES